MPIPIIPQTQRAGERSAFLSERTIPCTRQGTGGLESAGCYHTPLFTDADDPGLRIGLGNYFVQRDPGRDPGEKGEPAIWLQFVIKGSLYYRLDGVANPGSMEEGQFNMFSLPSAGRISWFDPRNSHTQTLDLYFSPRALEKAAAEFPVLAELLVLQSKGLPALLSPWPGKVGPMMMRMLNEIIHCEFADEARRIYMLAKVSELLVMALVRIGERSVEKEQRIHLKKSDIECIRESRDWLMSHMDNPPTLKQLAHHAGINDFKLKKGYKQVFGTTVFCDFHRERMTRARKFLLETPMALIEVALLSGYQDASNFSRAFKAYFGFTAGELRKQD